MSQPHRDVLQRLAERTGGTFLAATDAQADPSPVAAKIEGMQKRELTQSTVATLEERFQWPLGVGAAALLVWLVLSPYRPLRVPAP